jgi:hypothetical protein
MSSIAVRRKVFHELRLMRNNSNDIISAAYDTMELCDRMACHYMIEAMERAYLWAEMKIHISRLIKQHGNKKNNTV